MKKIDYAPPIMFLAIIIVLACLLIFSLKKIEENQRADFKFCYEQGGFIIEAGQSPYLCLFTYGNQWSTYYIETMKADVPWHGYKKGDKCFVCWDEGSCERDTLTKIDNGTRRHERC